MYSIRVVGHEKRWSVSEKGLRILLYISRRISSGVRPWTVLIGFWWLGYEGGTTPRLGLGNGLQRFGDKTWLDYLLYKPFCGDGFHWVLQGTNIPPRYYLVSSTLSKPVPSSKYGTLFLILRERNWVQDHCGSDYHSFHYTSHRRKYLDASRIF